MMYRLFLRVPIIKTIVKIANQYVYSADPRASFEFAPLRLWLAALGAPLIISGILTGATFAGLLEFREALAWDFNSLRSVVENPREIMSYIAWVDSVAKDSVLLNPGSLVLDVFPSLLGFGIGVYALVFSLSGTVLRLLQDHIVDEIARSKRTAGSALMLNASMGYPLLVLSLGVMLGVFQKMYPEGRTLLTLAWFSFWYGCIVLIELIGVLFGLGENDALDKLDGA